MILAILLFISGIAISIVAEYYSIMGLMAIFSAAPIPIAVMGIALGIGKLVQATWLKAYWPRLPATIKLYGVLSVSILMLITTLGCFGFLSKAHSDQTLVSGDSQAKVAIYDEKIKTAKDNIEANRKAIRQMDEAVDQVMGRSNDEKGADKAVAIRRSQTKERVRLLGEIENEQRNVARLSEERAPYAAEFRKMESEVGPIKYIAAFIYGDNPDANVLERAVTWVIVLIVIVFDPLAVVMLLASQMTWQWIKKPEQEPLDTGSADTPEYTIDELVEQAEEHTPVEVNKHTQSVVENDTDGELPAYLTQPFAHFENVQPMPAPHVEPEPVLELAPFDVPDAGPNWTLITEQEHAKAEQVTQELVDYIQSLQSDFSTVTDLHQHSIAREAELMSEVSQLTAQLENRAAMSITDPEDVALRAFTEEEIMAMGDGVDEAAFLEQFQDNLDKAHETVDERLAAGQAVSITEMPQAFRDFVSAGISDGTLEIRGSYEPEVPLIKALEGEAAAQLLTDIGIFNADGKLAPEYGGEELKEQDDSAGEASVAPISQPEPEILALGIDVTDRPGDYITDPVEELFARKADAGFGDTFPNSPVKGDLFLRTDFRPSRLFKWNDIKWIEINKNSTDAYSYNDAYIQYLADKLSTNEIMLDDLTETEISQVQTLLGGRRV